MYDTTCGLSRTTWKSVGAITVASTALVLKTGVSQPDNWFAQGEVLMTSGVAAGVRRSIRASAADGTITLSQPLPAVPAIGDTLEVVPGCDLGQGTCSTKFNNLLRFRGTPYVPVPETVR